jgi:hypothetical protein
MLAALLPLALLLALPEPPSAAADGKPALRTWLESGPREKCVDVLFVGDGYTEKDLSIQAGKFWKDVGRYSQRLFKDEPFLSYRDKFNVRAAFLESKERGCAAAKGESKPDTALGSYFDTKEGRLLVFKDAARLKQVVEESGGADLVFVMVNTERYGGAGTVLSEIRVRERALPAPTFSAQDTASFLIAVHELGHSFAGLADEYVDEPLQPTFKIPEKGDLDAPNATLARCVDASTPDKLAKTVKWKHFLALPDARKHAWLEEGAYYREKGVFRPWKTCRMLRHDDDFCPVCCEEVAKSILGCCGETWDDALWHKTHPLGKWH